SLTFLVSWANASHPPGGVALTSIARLLGSNRVPPQGFAAYTRMKNADSLDVVAALCVDRTPNRSLLESELRIGVRGSVYILRRIKNDRCGLSRLSKIAHL